MFTQFFGNFLVNEGFITTKQLLDALTAKANTKLKLGVLAINADYMTSDQVDVVHEKQTVVDKRFGDIAIEMGFLNNEQVNELLTTQRPDYLLLGQALMDTGALTNEKFQEAMNIYKEKNRFTQHDMLNINSDKNHSIIKYFFNFDKTKNPDYFVSYVELLLNNLIRFLGDDFTLMLTNKVEETQTKKLLFMQKVLGPFSTTSTLTLDENAMIEFACRYADEKFTEINEYVEASVCDFLNLHNGLFAVNISQEYDIELNLTPPEIIEKSNSVENEEMEYTISICYPFGNMIFTFTA